MKGRIQVGLVISVTLVVLVGYIVLKVEIRAFQVNLKWLSPFNGNLEVTLQDHSKERFKNSSLDGGRLVFSTGTYGSCAPFIFVLWWRRGPGECQFCCHSHAYKGKGPEVDELSGVLTAPTDAAMS